MDRIILTKRSLCIFAMLFFIALLISPKTAITQTVTQCPGLFGNYVVLENQNYALCAGAQSVNFDEITYATCSIIKNGNSISEEQSYPFPSVPPSGKNINTVNQGAPTNGYMVSTYSPPAGVTSPNGNLALYTCDGGGSYAQCDGGICFTSTTGKSSPLWGAVSSNQIVCSCPITTTKTSFQVFGPNPCPKKPRDYDAICATNVSKVNNGATIYIGSPSGYPEKLAACLTGTSQNFNTCKRPSR